MAKKVEVDKASEVLSAVKQSGKAEIRPGRITGSQTGQTGMGKLDWDSNQIEMEVRLGWEVRLG
jgi:hypothetical protein